MKYAFANCELDTSSFELKREGRVRAIEPKVFELLRYFVENPNRLISKNELFENVWQGRVVSDSALSSQIKAARRAIGDGGGTKQLLKTVHGRGFRLVSDVTIERAPSDDASAITETENQGGLNLVSVAEELNRPSIAVLAFKNSSDDPDQEYFSDGIAEDIITQISKYRWFFVIARNSSFAFKNSPLSHWQIASELGVRYVLEGSVRRSEERVRIACQLIDARSGIHIWGDKFDTKLTDVFEVQDEISSAIVGAVAPEIAAAEEARARRAKPENMAAWDYHLRGMWHLWRYTREDGIEARKFFESAIVLDPELSQSYSGLSLILTHHILMGWEEDSAGMLSLAKHHAEIALKLDAKDSFAHYCMGRVLTFFGDSEGALNELYRARELNPNSSLAHFGLGFTLAWFDKGDEAIGHLERAIRQSPNDPILWSFEMIKGMTLWRAGKVEEAIAVFARARRQPNAPFWPAAAAAVAYTQLNMPDAAREAVSEALTKMPELTVTAMEKMLATMASGLRSDFLAGLRAAGFPQS